MSELHPAAITEAYRIILEDRVVVVRMCGQWTKAIASDVFAVIRELISKLPPNQPWATLTDFTGWKDDVDEDVLNIGAQIVKHLDDNGRTHRATVIGSMKVGEQLLQGGLIDPKRPARHFPTEERAREWLQKLGYCVADVGQATG